jgi:hypothetical protein
VPGNLLAELVDNNRATNKDRYARNSSWPGALCSTEGRIHLRRLVFSPSAFSLQSDDGPYIFGHVIRPGAFGREGDFANSRRQADHCMLNFGEVTDNPVFIDA